MDDATDASGLNITMSKWLPEALPSDWSNHHARWSTFHRVRVILAIIAIASCSWDCSRVRPADIAPVRRGGVLV